MFLGFHTEMTSTFRGRQLQGQAIEVPQGYKGTVHMVMTFPLEWWGNSLGIKRAGKMRWRKMIGTHSLTATPDGNINHAVKLLFIPNRYDM